MHPDDAAAVIRANLVRLPSVSHDDRTDIPVEIISRLQFNFTVRGITASRCFDRWLEQGLMGGTPFPP